MLQAKFVASLVMLILVLSDAPAVAQTYPNKPVRLVTPGVGGSADFVSRLIAQGISGPLGQQVIVDNRSSGAVVGQIASKASADGYTLLVDGPPLWIGPLLRNDAPWHPVRDFSPITLAASSPNILVVHPAVAAKSVKELIALAKAKPGELNYASSSTGGGAHLAAELFKVMAGVNIVRVSYKSTGAALNDVLSGQVQLMFAPAGGVIQQVQAGRLRALAVTSAQPSALYPDLPTIAASGISGYETVSRTGIFAPVKTPAAIITRLNQEIVRFVRAPETKEKFMGLGLEPVGSSPAEFAAIIDDEIAKMGKVIKDAGIKAE